MTHTIMLIPSNLQADTKSAAKKLEGLLTKNSIRTSLFSEIDLALSEQLLATNNLDNLLEKIVKEREQLTAKNDVIIVQGASLAKPYAAELNYSLATALGATIIFVMAGEQGTEESSLQQLKIIANPYYYRHPKTIIGLIVNADNDQIIKSIEKYSVSLSPKLQLINAPNNNLDFNSIGAFLKTPVTQAITPALFKYRLIERAKSANKTIVLPEGDESRTIAAANICAERGLAQCILLEDKNKIAATCEKLNLKLHEKIKIIEPQSIIEKYVPTLYELRKAKGMTPDRARKQLEDHVMLGTMMLNANEVDGLVSGAVHTTANTILPAFQIIKTTAGMRIVSSIFFMCLPDQVLVFGDCAVNPNPTAEELADIAIQSAASAAAFDITPRVAMLSYSTGTSGTGPSVDRVRAATEIVRKLRPDLEIEGPMQYDAAISEETARIKAPNSKIAGHATVFVMPSLDVGNIVYKAVQRGTGIVCIGPMLQGLRKPVNDLSRGCSVDDIVFTIAVTAIQAIY